MPSALLNRLNPLTETETKTVPSRYSKGEWKIVECLETGMVYLENPPNYEALEEDFAWEKTSAREKERRQKEEPLFSKLSDVSKKSRELARSLKKMDRLPADFLKSQLPERRPTGKMVLLDVGCGYAENTLVIADQIQKRLGIEVTPIGVEISREQAKRANESLARKGGGYCIQNSAIGGTKEIEDRSVDVVVLCSFLEHEVRPLELLKLCREKLTANGIVVIKVPNFACWNRLIRQEKWCGFRYPDHVNYFTPKTLRAMVVNAGMRVGRMHLSDRFPLNDNMYVVAQR